MQEIFLDTNLIICIASFFLVLFFLFFRSAGAIISMSEKNICHSYLLVAECLREKFLSDFRGAVLASLFSFQNSRSISETTVLMVSKFLTYSLWNKFLEERRQREMGKFGRNFIFCSVCGRCWHRRDSNRLHFAVPLWTAFLVEEKLWANM